MRIAFIIPGAGRAYYCQNCIRDGDMVKALRGQGQEVIPIPMYLPLVLDDPGIGKAPLFFGALNVYLQEKSRLFRRLPRWLDRWMDSPRLLDWVATKAGSTDAVGLEEMTLSMLRGEKGRQAKELDRLMRWLREEGRPEVVHLSNGLLLGLAPRIKKELNATVVCSLQDEDDWIEAMGEEYASRVWQAMGVLAEQVDAFVPVSRTFGDRMREKMGIPADRMHVVPIGIDLEGIGPVSPASRPTAIGYLSRITEKFGLDILVEAFIRLKKEARFKDLRLRVMGGGTKSDEPFLEEQIERAKGRGVLEAIDMANRFDRLTRGEFLQSLTVLCVPKRTGGAFGLYLLEAMAFGVPVVQPKLGAFPEIIEATGGGVLYEPNNAAKLADALASLLTDPEKAQALGRSGREAVFERFGAEKMAQRLVGIYEGVSRS
ncbi:MAG: glycosyltransferase family 4 protein [Planctomycetota bacterium]|jgi:glycosyltransferase involved in cell wall biosynthesis